MTKITKLYIGADPELFVRRENTFVSGHTFDCGTKDRPLATKHGAVQVDGVALECNIRPAETEDEFAKNAAGVMSDLVDIVAAKDPEAAVVAVPVARFHPAYLHGLPNDVKALGCNPDYNAYTGMHNMIPNAHISFRTGAGHVHIGWTHEANVQNALHFEDCRQLARQLDYFLGLPSLLWDKDTHRRILYGKAGCFRPKPYGMEYRTLSNAWLNSSSLIRVIFRNTVKAFRALEAGKDYYTKHGTFAQEQININNPDWHHINPDWDLFKEIAQCPS